MTSLRHFRHAEVLAGLVNDNGWREGAEIGVLKGATFFYLLDQCPDLVMTGVDPWKQMDPSATLGSKTYAQHDMAALRKDVQHRAEAYGYRARILPIPSTVAAGIVDDNTLDFVFIDADHTTESVRSDIANWRPKLKRGGTMCGHDEGWESVRAALKHELKNGWDVMDGGIWVARPER